MMKLEEVFFLEVFGLAANRSLDVDDPERWLGEWYGRPLTHAQATRALCGFRERYRNAGNKVLRDARPDCELPALLVDIEPGFSILIGCRSEHFREAEIEAARLRMDQGEISFVLHACRRLCGENMPLQDPEQFLGRGCARIVDRAAADKTLEALDQTYRDMYAVKRPRARRQEPRPVVLTLEKDHQLIFGFRRFDPTGPESSF